MKKNWKYIETGLLCLFVFLIYATLFVSYYIWSDFKAYRFEEILFFLSMPIGGISFSMFFRALFFVLIYPTLLLFLTILFFRRLSLKKKNTWKHIFLIFFLFILVNLGCYLFFSQNNKSYEQVRVDDFNDKENLIALKENIRFPFFKKNLIVIFLESFEQTFGDKEFYKYPLLQPLEEFEKRGISFERYRDGFGMTPSMPSLIAFYTGLPVFNVKPFAQEIPFKNVYSLGKILKDAGYYNVSLIACQETFEGGRQLFEQYGMKENIGLETIEKMYPDLPKKGWGYADQDLFFVARQKIMELEDQQPFFLLIQTMDTHANYLPPRAIEDRFDNDAYNVIYNTAKETVDFLKWLEGRRIFDKTTIVVLGDHLRKGHDIKYPDDRNVYNLFINTVANPDNKNRTLNQIDLFPSVLEAMGVKVKHHKLGFGTSVFSNQPTLAEQYSFDEQKEYFKTNKKLLNLIKGEDDD